MAPARRTRPALLALMLMLLMMGMATGGARAQQPVQGIQGTQENRPPSWLARELPAPRLAGQGRFTWFGMGIYRARLWVGPQGYRASAPQATPFVLDLRYERALRGSKIADASADEMEKIGAGSPAQRQAWRETMRTIFPDVKEGTHIAGVYVPGAGAHFYLDDQPLAQVDDPAFAAAFFAIWLSPATSARDLRGDLLRDAAPLSVAPVP